MAIDLTLNTISSGYNIVKINENFERIDTALQDAVSLSGTSPNQMTADLDLNGQSILNIGSLGISGGGTILDQVGYAEEWASKAEDSLVSTDAGGDGSTEYSALHWAAKAADDVVATNADVVLTNADVVTTGTSETNAANSAAAAAASAQGFSGVTLITAASNDVETTDARTYYQISAASNTVAMNLPSIGTGNDGLSYTIEVLDVSNAITLVRDGTDTINGVAGNYTGLAEAGQVIQIIADDGAPDNWIVVQASALKVDGTTVELTGRTIGVVNGGIDTTQLADDSVDPTKAIAGINAQTGTTYTLALTDNIKMVSMSNASTNVLTIPTNASIAFTAEETQIDVGMLGAGVTSITAASGVTLNGVSAGSIDLVQYGAGSLLKIGTDAWWFIGSGTVA